MGRLHANGQLVVSRGRGGVNVAKARKGERGGEVEGARTALGVGQELAIHASVRMVADA